MSTYTPPAEGTTEPRVRWCDRDDAHPAHERRNQFGGKGYCTGSSEEAAARGRPSPPAPAAEGDAVLDRAAAAFADAWTGVATLREGVRAALTAAGPIIAAEVREQVAQEIEAARTRPEEFIKGDRRRRAKSRGHANFNAGLTRAARIARGEGA